MSATRSENLERRPQAFVAMDRRDAFAVTPVRRRLVPRGFGVHIAVMATLIAGACVLGWGSPAHAVADGAPATPANSVPAARRFQSDAGRFEIWMPDEPAVQSSARMTVGGPVRSSEYLVERPAYEFWVEHHDIPRVGSLVMTDGALLGRAQRDFLEAVDGHERSYSEDRLGSFPAREVAFEVLGQPERVGRALLALVGRRLYLIATIHERQDPLGARLERMLRTFRVWEQR